MSEEENILIPEDNVPKKDDTTIDSIFGLKALIATVSTVSLTVYLFAVIILLIADAWLGLFLCKLINVISTKFVLINIPLYFLSLLLFIQVVNAKGYVC